MYKIDLTKNKFSTNNSILDKIHNHKQDLRQHENLRLNLIKKNPLNSPCDRSVILEDRFTNKNKEFLMFGSNSYLGATILTQAIQRAIEVTKKYGIGAGGVPLLTGTTIFQNELENKIAEVKGCEDAILFSSGFTANVGALVGLIRPNNLVVHDKLNHASLIDGTLMCGAKMTRYQHNNPASLEKILAENYKSYPEGILVVTDGVFSMDGDIANIPELLAVIRKYNAILLIDDAHATGVIGVKGKGTLSHFGITDRRNIIITGTLSKAIGTVGGFIAADKEIIDYLRIFARSNMYSTALPPSVCASAIEVFNYMEASEAVNNLKNNCAYLRNSLVQREYDILNSSTAIIPLIVADEYKLTELSNDFLERGIIVNFIFPPVVSPKLSRIRISVMATHTRNDIDRLVEVIDELSLNYPIRTIKK